MQSLVRELITTFNNSRLTQFEDLLSYADKNHFNFYNQGYRFEAKIMGSGYFSLSIWLDEQSEIDIVFKMLANSENTNELKALRFYHKGGQANGTIYTYYNELSSNKVFPNLTHFYIQHESEDGCVISDDDEFGGKLLGKLPKIKKLHLVSAPNIDFFEKECHTLTTLEVCGGYENNNFLQNLKSSNYFPNLKEFSYKDINKAWTGTPDEDGMLLTFNGILDFMDSRNLLKLEVLSLMELNITENQLEQLKNTHLGKQVKELKLGLQKDSSYFDEEYKADRNWFVNKYLSW
jgi:hypothetical protein